MCIHLLARSKIDRSMEGNQVSAQNGFPSSQQNFWRHRGCILLCRAALCEVHVTSPKHSREVAYAAIRQQSCGGDRS